MRSVTSAYRAEEQRLRGARPRVKVVLSPVPLDLGLGPGLGVYEHTAYGGEPGRLVLDEGYWEYAAWTSPVRQVPLPEIGEAQATWEEQVPYMRVTVSLRTAATEAGVALAPYVALKPGKVVDLQEFFQVKVDFTDSTWAGEPAGYVANLALLGRLLLPEEEILNPGAVRVELARDFSEVRPGDHVLGVDNRQGQWLPGLGRFASLGIPRAERYVELYHGWELPGGEVEWLLIYRGAVHHLGGLSHAWRGPHQAELESRDRLALRLNRRIGAPSAAGERRPFMRGTYRARAELVETIPAQVGAVRKTGSGSATLKVLGTYRGRRDTRFLLEAETAGEVGVATCRWSVNDGQSWRERNLVTAGAEDPVELDEGLAVYWESGIGPDFQAGDRFAFTATAPVYRYRVFGGPFAAIKSVYLNGEETWEGVEADPASGELLVTGQSALVEARVVKDATTHPVDILADILAEVGLGDCLHFDSFELAKSLTPEYRIGVCFENVPATQALREILGRTLYDPWFDFGEIKLQAYLGED